MRILVAFCLVAVACGKGASPASSGSGSSPASGSGSASASASASGSGSGSASGTGSAPAAISDSCTSPEDCTISCLESASDCCGDACGCGHPYTHARAHQIQTERDALCARKDYDCPKARCAFRRFWPGCEGGQCIAVPAPQPTVCTTDADCTTSTDVEGRCCGACDASVWGKSELAAFQTWKSAQCASVQCPQRTCPKTEPIKARCANSACVIARP